MDGAFEWFLKYETLREAWWLIIGSLNATCSDNSHLSELIARVLTWKRPKCTSFRIRKNNYYFSAYIFTYMKLPTYQKRLHISICKIIRWLVAVASLEKSQKSHYPNLQVPNRITFRTIVMDADRQIFVVNIVLK